MRWLSLLILVALSNVAAAKRMPARRPQPSILSSCLHGAVWNDITTCVRKFGTPRSVRASDAMHLLSVKDLDGNDLGLYLYVAGRDGWKLGGFHRADEEMLSFEPIEIAKHRGYRFEFGTSLQSSIELPDSTTTPAIFSTRVAVYCGGDSAACTEVTTACDILIRGKAYRTFRGTVEFPQPTELLVVGDRTKAGLCAPPEHVFLNWPQG